MPRQINVDGRVTLSKVAATVWVTKGSGSQNYNATKAFCAS